MTKHVCMCVWPHAPCIIAHFFFVKIRRMCVVGRRLVQFNTKKDAGANNVLLVVKGVGRAYVGRKKLQCKKNLDYPVLSGSSIRRKDPTKKHKSEWNLHFFKVSRRGVKMALFLINWKTLTWLIKLPIFSKIF